MKLKLEKQKIVSLSENEMSAVNGGGVKWSNRRHGNCKYSNDHKDMATFCVDGKEHKRLVGCTA